MKKKKILIVSIDFSKEFYFLEWIYGSETIIAIVEDINCGEIEQYKLDTYSMKFITDKN